MAGRTFRDFGPKLFPSLSDGSLAPKPQVPSPEPQEDCKVGVWSVFRRTGVAVWLDL